MGSGKKAEVNGPATVLPLRPRRAGQPAEMNLRILAPAARWVRESHGPEALERIAIRSGMELALLDDPVQWVSLRQFEDFLAGVHELAGSDEAFQDACVHKLEEAYGPLRYLLWALSPEMVAKMGASTLHVVCRIGRFEVEESPAGRNRLLFRYYSNKKESRLSCLSRQAQGLAQPTLWGMPRPRIKESKCIGWGDEHCEYEYRYFARPAKLPFVLGLLCGAVFSLGLFAAGIGDMALWLAIITLCGGAGHVLNLRRANNTNLAMADEVREALNEVVHYNSQATQEILALQERQFEWMNLMEEQVGERNATIQELISRFRFLREHRESQVRGFSHDLRNPLAVLQAGIDQLSSPDAYSETDLRRIITYVQDSATRMERLIDEMMETAVEHTRLVRAQPKAVSTDELPERFKRRLKALAHAKGLRTSVFRTREMPASANLDPLILDRVVDNLLTNAVKYTHRGSIVVELSGKPGFLTIKISDTGQGIDDAEIRGIFEPSLPRQSSPTGYGVGLSVVVQLMSQIGGKLEVMSKPEVGTTFWAHFPTSSEACGESSEDDSTKQIFAEIVTIRKLDA